MAVVTGSISNLPNAATLNGEEYLVVDQAVGTPAAATALTVGLAYRIVALGTTDWAVVGAGATAAVGTQFKCEAIGTGTGTAVRVESRKVDAQTIVGLADPTQEISDAITALKAEPDPFPNYLQIGEYAPSIIDARNNTGSQLAKGAPVYITGSSGILPTIAAADASDESTAAQTLGLMYVNTSSNADGKVITKGFLTGVNTSNLTEGGIIWLSETTGQLTSVRPTQPAHGVFLGFCVKQSAGTSGILYVNVINGQELYELHDVLISGSIPQAGAPRPVLARQSNGLWSDVLLAPGDVGAATSAQGALATTAVQPGPIGGSGLTTSEGLLGRITSGTGAVVSIPLGSGLAIVNGSLVATGAGSGTVTSVGISVPAGLTVAGSPVTTAGTIAIGLSAGFSIPATSDQANWNTAYSERLRWNITASSTYTASGSISITDQIAYINSANNLTMTLAGGAIDGHILIVKRLGAGTVTISGFFDQASNRSIVADSATIKESVMLSWSASLGYWVIL
jgi:hypothetical protein